MEIPQSKVECNIINCENWIGKKGEEYGYCSAYSIKIRLCGGELSSMREGVESYPTCLNMELTYNPKYIDVESKDPLNDALERFLKEVDQINFLTPLIENVTAHIAVLQYLLKKYPDENNLRSEFKDNIKLYDVVNSFLGFFENDVENHPVVNMINEHCKISKQGFLDVYLKILPLIIDENLELTFNNINEQFKDIDLDELNIPIDIDSLLKLAKPESKYIKYAKLFLNWLSND